MNQDKIICGDSLEVLKTLESESVDCIITSPPYWGLRDYGVKGQLGLEKTPEEYVNKLVKIFREAKRALKKEGTLWLNLGDSYAVSQQGGQKSKAGDKSFTNKGTFGMEKTSRIPAGLKQKDLCGIPWRVAFALQADGWYLRQDIIWAKPNPMPESVTDRCTKSHEYVFLLAKSQKYYFDNEAIKEKGSDETPARLLRGVSDSHKNINGAPGQTPQNMNKPRKNYTKEMGGGGTSFNGHSGYFKADGTLISDGMRNKRSVWTITTKPYKEAHFATFPQDLIIPMIKAGCPEKGIVLDPFMGSGTTAITARTLSRYYLGIELNPEYIKLAEDRLKQNILF